MGGAQETGYLSFFLCCSTSEYARPGVCAPKVPLKKIDIPPCSRVRGHELGSDSTRLSPKGVGCSLRVMGAFLEEVDA